MSDSYCKLERSSIESQQRMLDFDATNLNMKVTQLNNLISQIKLAKSSNYSSASYVNSLIDSYNMQLGFYKSAIRDYNFKLDTINNRIRNYNFNCGN